MLISVTNCTLTAARGARMRVLPVGRGFNRGKPLICNILCVLYLDVAYPQCGQPVDPPMACAVNSRRSAGYLFQGVRVHGAQKTALRGF